MSAQRRRQRSVRVVVAVALLAAAAVLVAVAVVVASVVLLSVAAITAVVAGAAAARIIAAELAVTRREWARDRAELARDYARESAERAREQAAFAADMTARVESRDQQITELAGTVRLAEARAVEARHEVNRHKRRNATLQERVDELLGQQEQLAAEAAEASTIVDLLRWEEAGRERQEHRKEA